LGFLLSGVRPEWERHGVEVSRFGAEQARQWGEIFMGTIEQAGYPDAFFDLGVMHHVIEHIDDPERTIVEVKRILKPGGHLVLGSPDFDSGCARRFGENYRLLHDGTHVSLFTNESMHRFLRDYGFVIDRVEYPFFETRYFTEENLMRLFDTSAISPSFYGNFMTFYCRKPDRGPVYDQLKRLSVVAQRMAENAEADLERAAERIVTCASAGGCIWIGSDLKSAVAAQYLASELEGVLETHDRFKSSFVVTDARTFEGTEGLFVVLAVGPPDASLRAQLKAAQERGLGVLAFCGEHDVDQYPECDVSVALPGREAERILELEIGAIHAIRDALERIGCAQTGESDRT